MEVSTIQHTHSVKNIQGVQAKGEIKTAAPIVDGVSISPKAQKMAQWVDMLKAMPDVRPETAPHPLPADIDFKVAEKILSTII